MSRRLLWVPAVLWMAAIFTVSALPDIGPLPGKGTDKSLHMAEYAILAVLLLLPLSDGRWSGVTWRRALAAFGIAVLYGIGDEFHQGFVPGRVPDRADLYADAAGAAAGVAAVWGTAAARACGILKSSSHRPSRS